MVQGQDCQLQFPVVAVSRCTHFRAQSSPRSRSFRYQCERARVQGYEQFRHLLLQHLRPSDRVLILGCGNSALAFDLCKDGVHDITSLDISPVVIDRMRVRSAELGLPQLVWTVGDMLSLPFQNGSFDVVIEKGAFEDRLPRLTWRWATC